MSETYDFSEADSIAVAAIGEPGQRVFLLQARHGRAVLTLKIEKAQLASLVHYLAQLISEMPRPGELSELEPLDPSEPIDFVAGTMALQYDEGADRVEITIDEAGDPDGAQAFVGMSRERAASLAIEGTRLIEGGRPPCPLCGYPLDPNGHNCPRTNGHSAPTL
ncbi:MAG: DUF3090 family protein [Acidimicrobiales bacterium]